MHIQRIIIIAAALTGAAAGFLPWLTFDFFPAVKGFDGLGKITTGLFIAALILALFKPGKSLINRKLSYIALITGLLNIAVSLYHIIGKQSAFSLNSMMAEDSTIGVALYMILLSGILISVASTLSMPGVRADD